MEIPEIQVNTTYVSARSFILDWFHKDDELRIPCIHAGIDLGQTAEAGFANRGRRVIDRSNREALRDGLMKFV